MAAYVHTEYYEFIGVHPSASPDDIRRAYKKRAAALHPDRNPGQEENFKKLQRINEVLMDDDKRERYDQGGEAALEKGPDIFESMFKSHQKQERKGENFVRQLGVDLESLYKGYSKKLKITKKIICPKCEGTGSKVKGGVRKCQTCKGAGRRVQLIQRGFMLQQVAIPCQDCGGEGEHNRDPCDYCGGEKVAQGAKEVDLVIDPGREDGQKVIISGEADETPGIPPGDIIFVLKEMPHAVFKRKGNDLFIKKRISLRDALCGFAFTITHLDGRQLIVKSVPGEVINAGISKFISGEGMPIFKQPLKKGKLYIEFDLVLPEKGQLSPENLAVLSKTLPPLPNADSFAPTADAEEVLIEDATVAIMNADTVHRSKEAYEREEEEEEDGPRAVQCGQQ